MPLPHRPPQRGFEDFTVGEKFYAPSRTHTESLFYAFQLASGDNAPIHLLSYEMFASLRRCLTPGGAMSFNIFGSIRGPGARLVAALVRTLREGPEGTGPFPHVQVFSEEATSEAHNVFILAAADPARSRPNGVLSVVPPRHVYRLVEEALRDQTAKLEGVRDAPVLLDDYNPAEHLDVAVRIQMRENIRKYWGEALAE